MSEVEQRRVEYEEFIEEQSQSQGRNMQLEENQVMTVYWLPLSSVKHYECRYYFYESRCVDCNKRKYINEQT